MTDREVMQMALDAMASFEGGTNGLYKGEFAEEIAALRAQLEQPDRRVLQAAGTHPAPCARHCEAKSFEIEVRSLKSALRAQLEQQQAEPVAWQLIETAPKDGNAILVMRDIWPGTKSGRAEECNGHNTYIAAWWDEENNGRGAWVCYMDSVCEPQCPIQPTHWMPLPYPPSIAPPQRKPLTNHELEICIGYRLPDAGFDAIRELIEAAHGIGEKP